MGVQISYMGTKRQLAGVVAEIVASLPDGPMLDAFSGMCAVGEAVAPQRPVWANDCQVFPAIVAKSVLTARSAPPCSEHIRKILETPYFKNVRALESRFRQYLQTERTYLSTGTLSDAIRGNTHLPYIGTDRGLEAERRRLARRPTTFPYRLASITYIGSFFGVQQSIEIDSLRYAIDFAKRSRLITREERDWLLIALCQVASRVNNSTGQFAQYIKPKGQNLDRIIQKRRRSVWEEFFLVLDSISPLQDPGWRARNRAFRSDALVLLRKMRLLSERPCVVYADPPYSKAQYSRYYHVLDMLIEYRYPPVTGAGRYPDQRRPTSFAHARSVVRSVERLVESAASLKASLVLSYPNNGLLQQMGANALEILRRHYRHVELAHSEARSHSTFGGQHAACRVPVVENVYIGRF